MKNKKILIFILFALAIIFLGATTSQATLNLNELEFDAQINTDGSMDVTETWNINISDTNTLFKTFKRDSSKYSRITDVTVKDVTSQKNFSKINTEMYHVTKNCYYALDNSKGMFEIAWGVGLDDSSETRTYEITYTVKDAVAKYKDYSELYWQFIGEDFEIDAEKVRGTILLPINASNKDDIRVWGHTKDLNGEIYVTDLNKIEFTINNYSSGNYVEVRSLIPNNMISTTKRTYNYNILNTVLAEENKWADEANARREMAKKAKYIFWGIIILIAIFFIVKIIKNLKKLVSLEKKFKPTTELQYFRELPYEDATPAEALFVMSNGNNKGFASSFSANILDLCLKKYLTLEVEKKSTVLSSDVVKINILEKDNTELKEDQNLTLDFLKEVAGEAKKLTTKDITKYLKKHLSKIEKLDSRLGTFLKQDSKERGVYSKEKSEEYDKIAGVWILYLMAAIFTIAMPVLAIVFFINFIITLSIANKINVLTQKGVDEKEQWKAFKKYMEDFSLLKEREVPELVIWEKYLVFATAFGISEKVLKQLKVIYPEITDMNSTIATYSYINLISSVDIGKCINTSVYSAMPSSGSGGGGGFSGGGGGGRWPEVAVAGANVNILKLNLRFIHKVYG